MSTEMVWNLLIFGAVITITAITIIITKARERGK